jgi:hypothetical protein
MKIKKNFGKLLLKREGLRLARGAHTQLITCWPRSCPCIAITKRTSRERPAREEKERDRARDNVCELSRRRGEKHGEVELEIPQKKMLPSRLNEMEEGFLFFSPLQQDTPDSPKTRYPYCTCVLLHV